MLPWGRLGAQGLGLSLRWTPHPVIVTIRDNRDHIRVLLYSYYTTITGWGVLLSYPFRSGMSLHSISTKPCWSQIKWTPRTLDVGLLVPSA